MSKSFHSRPILGLLSLSACGMLFASQSALALECEKSYGFQVNQGNVLCSSKSAVFLDALANFQLSSQNYTDTSAASVNGRFNDVGINLAYQANATQLMYRFPELGVEGSFDGGSRSASQALFKDYVKKHDIIGKIMRYQAEHSASSPITGAGGLMPMAAAADADLAFSAPARTGDANSVLGAAFSYGSLSVDKGGDKVKTMSLPVSFSIKTVENQQLVFNLPLSQTEIGGAKSYQVGAGVAYRLPVTTRWTLTPAVKYSVVGSKDRATVATVYSASLGSVYTFPAGPVSVSVGNMVGLYKTGKFSSGDYAFNPDIQQTILRNGLMLSQPVALLGRSMAIQYSLVDTRYLGDKPYLRDMQEVSVTLGSSSPASSFRAGLTWMHAKGSKGLTANMGYWF